MHHAGLVSVLIAALAVHAVGAADTGSIVGAPLARQSRSAGSTMFTRVAPEDSGVVTTNRYADPAMWGARYQELAYGTMGCGVAVGDYDNDGRPDIFAVSKTERCRLFRNLGDWQFADVTEAAGLVPSGSAWSRLKGWIGLGDDEEEPVTSWHHGATFVDINNDGWLDLYLCRFAAPNLLYVNQGDGTFVEEAEARGLAVNDASGMAAFHDYDRDGWLDVYVQTNMRDAVAHPEGQRDYLFRNRGDGTFENVTAAAGIVGESSGHSVTWWDYDGDGWTDLYVANDYAVPDWLYRNNRDGTFTNVIGQVVPRTPYYAMGADSADVNNDGWTDLLVGDMAPTTHEKDQRGMAGSRSRAQTYSDSEAAPQYMQNALYLNTGRGVMREVAHLAGLAASDWTWSFRLEDFDNDGWVDVHITNGMIREYHNADLLDRMMAVEDLTGGRRMVRESPVLAERNLAFRNRDGLRFEEMSTAWGLDHVGVSFGAATGDFDGDGDLDLVYANYEAGHTLLRNDSTSGHRAIVALRGTRSNRLGVGAVVRVETASGRLMMRTLVLARGYLSSSEPILHFGLGNEDRIARLSVEWPSGAVQSFSDLPADQRFTIVEPATAPASPPAPPTLPAGQFRDVSEAMGLTHEARLEVPGPISAQPLLPLRLELRGPALAIGRLGSNAAESVVVGGTRDDPWRIWQPIGDGRSTMIEGTSPANGPLLLFDANGDGADDLFTTGGRAGEQGMRLLLHDGGGGFAVAPGALPELKGFFGALGAADFDRDGRLDLFVGARVKPGEYPLPPRSALLVNRGGRFADVTDSLAPELREIGMVTAALWSDVDDDGWIDLLLALDWGGVRWLRNNQGRGFEDRSAAAGFAAAGEGWWRSLAAADFNHDGRMDYVAGNVGLNTPYRASPEHPALLFHGDFRGGGRTAQLVEAYYEGDRLFPRRSRNDLVAQIPPLGRRFAKVDDYARATLEEIVGADRLAAARRFAATELRSGVFLSQPDGRFQFRPLPDVVQIAPLQGTVAGDFDGDGHADILAVQNSHAPIPLLGRFAGGVGQFLRGDGRGGFTAVPPVESGFVVTGDAEALASVDFDENGWADFVVTRHGGTMLAWRNQGVPDRRALSVVVHGPATNHAAVGSRITLVMADGSTQSAEVSCGGGYMSQSSAAVFFGYTEDRPPRYIRVRWPTGEITEHAFSPGVSRQVISLP